MVAEKLRAVLGVIELKDVVEGEIREHFDELLAMSIKTVMITGDNPLSRQLPKSKQSREE